MRSILSLIFLTCLLCLPAALHAQDESSPDSLTIFFRVGRYNYDPAYMGNGERMGKFIDRFQELYDNNKLIRVLELSFSASASPEGNYEQNAILSKRRADTMEDYLRKHTVFKDSAIVIIEAGEAWEGLKDRVLKCDMPWRDSVLNIIDSYPLHGTADDGKVIELRKSRLMEYEGGAPWRYMLKNWFPELRQFIVVIKTGVAFPQLDEAVIEDEEVDIQGIHVEDKPVSYTFMPVPSWTRKVLLKTNMIGLGMGHANIAVEVDLAPHWSISIPFYYSGGFDYFKETIKFRGIVLQPEARYYFKENKGMYIGAHLGLGWYNFAINGDYRTQDHKGRRPSWGGGIGVGYRLHFKRKPSWGMEFALGAGVYDSKYDLFYNEENGPYYKSGIRKTWLGVDNAAVSFFYKFDTYRKGGKK